MELEQTYVKYNSLLTAKYTIDVCQKYFALEYTSRKNLSGYNILSELIPYPYNGFQEQDISENISILSPVFAETFLQANIAEAKSLN